jgi:PiT family inorganic phosphate transporter
MSALVWIAALALAWSNGANDNFKGVATLHGSGTLTYRRALLFATLGTLLGSLLSVALAGSLAKSFSGSGIVPDELTRSAQFLAAVGVGAALTIALATRLGMPTSTTHALIGALVGAGLVADASGVQVGALLAKFLRPLLLSPLLAIGGTVIVYAILSRLRRGLGIDRESYVCVGQRSSAASLVPVGGAAVASYAPAPVGASLETRATCAVRYKGAVVGISIQRAVDLLHTLSGTLVCFARAVNDTPKVAALFIALPAAGVGSSAGSSATTLGYVAAAMALGGLLQARRVARTMSERITRIESGHGLIASLITATLVGAASTAGLPVSTTHVSCGSIFGIGLVRREASWRTIGQILTSWLTTLPLGLALGAGLFALLRVLA